LKYGWNKGKKYKKYRRLSKEEIRLIYKFYDEKIELRKIAKLLGVTLRTVQYHIEKQKQLGETWDKNREEK